MPRVLNARKEGTWVVYRYGRSLLQRREAHEDVDYETLCMNKWNWNNSLQQRLSLIELCVKVFVVVKMFGNGKKKWEKGDTLR